MSTDGWYFTNLEEDILPTQLPEYDWLSCSPQPLETPKSIFYTMVGKWLVFCRTIEENNELWPKLKSLLYQGQLGISIKSATEFSETAISSKGAQRGILICIYTKDWRDLDDIRRVLSTIRELGIQGPLYYKADKQTLLHMSGSIYVSKYGTHITVTYRGQEWLEQEGN